MAWPPNTHQDVQDAVSTLRFTAGTASTFIPPGWGSFWQPARAAALAGTARATVAFIGDSITQGFSSSNLYSTAYPHLIRSGLQTAYGDGGSGFLGVAHTAFWSTSEASGYTSQFRVTLTGTWTTLTPETDGTTGSGPGAVEIHSAVSGSTATFAAVRGTRVRVWWGKASGNGSFTVAIDGTTVGTVNTSTGGGGSVQGPRSSDFTVAAGSHTVVITTTASVNTLLYGVEGSNASGVRVDNFGRSTGDSRTFLGKTLDSTDSLPAWWSGGYQNPCDLLIYAMGVNDAANGNLTGDAYLYNVRALLDGVRQLSLGATDLIFFLPHAGKWDDTSMKYQEYATRLRGLSEAYRAVFIDAWADGRNSWNYYNSLGYWSDGMTGTGASGTNAVHPGDTGHAHYRDLIYPILTA